MQTRKNRKNKTFNRKNRGGGPKSKKIKSKEIKSKSPEKKIEKIASTKKININPIPLSKSPQSPNFLLSLLPNNKKEYESKKIHHEIKKENYKKYKTLNEIYGRFFEKLNELIVLFKSVDTDYINRKNLQSIIDSYYNVEAKIVDGLNLYREITHLEDQPDINIDNLITERQNYIDKIEYYKTKINNIIEKINKAKEQEIKKEEEDAIKRRLEEEEKKRRDEEYQKKKTAKKEEKKAAKEEEKAATKIKSAATKIQSLVRGRTSRKRYNIQTMRESAKKKAKESAERKKAKESAERKKSEAFAKIIDKTPQNITREEWSTFFEEDVEPIKNTIKDIIKIKDITKINKIIEKNETTGFREYYENEGAKIYSHVIFFILGFLTPLLEKKGVTMYLKGGQAIHLNTQPSTYPEYPSNDIDIDFIVDKKSGLEKKEVCYMIRNFIYWCVSDDNNIGYYKISPRFESFVSKNNFLSSIDSINVVKISYSYNGQMFALMDMSFKDTVSDTVSDLNKLFTRDYIKHKVFEKKGITHKYNYQSVLSMILEKMFILLHAKEPNIDIATKQVIIQKFKYSLCHIINLYMNVKNKEWKWVKDFNEANEVNKNVLIQLANMYYEYFHPTDANANRDTIMSTIFNEVFSNLCSISPESIAPPPPPYQNENELLLNMKDHITTTVSEFKNDIIYVIGNNQLINKTFNYFLEHISKVDTYEKLCHHIITDSPLIIKSINTVLADMRKQKSLTSSIKIKTQQIKYNLNEIINKIIILQNVENELSGYFNTLCQ